MFKYFNPNPRHSSVGDCTVRAIAGATAKTWDETFIGLCVSGFETKDMPSANRVWGLYLKDCGFSRKTIPDTCPDCYTVRDFCTDNPKGVFVLGTGSHVVCIKDGDWYDTWDSGDEAPIYYWERKI